MGQTGQNLLSDVSDSSLFDLLYSLVLISLLNSCSCDELRLFCWTLIVSGRSIQIRVPFDSFKQAPLAPMFPFFMIECLLFSPCFVTIERLLLLTCCPNPNTFNWLSMLLFQLLFDSIVGIRLYVPFLSCSRAFVLKHFPYSVFLLVFGRYVRIRVLPFFQWSVYWRIHVPVVQGNGSF